MTKRITHDLPFAKKLGLAIAATAALVAPVFVGMLHSPAAFAQSAAAVPAPSPAPFVVVTPPPEAKPRPLAIRPLSVPGIAMAPQAAVRDPALPEPQIPPGTTPQEAKKIRAAWAQANLFPNRAMASAYTLFGPPNRKESGGTVEIWQYDFLDAYQSRVTLEFSPGAPSVARITWPAQTTFGAGSQIDAAATAKLSSELGRELSQDTSAPPQAGLPGSQAFLEPSLQLNRAEHLMNLVVPTDSLLGRVDLIA